jgi:hypothetical protein
MTAKTTAPAKVRTCSWKPDGEKRCGAPTIRPSAATCRDHAQAWLDAHGRKATAMSFLTVAEVAKAKAARKAKIATAPPAPKPKAAAKPKAPAKPKPAPVATDDPMTRELAAVRAMKEKAE